MPTQTSNFDLDKPNVNDPVDEDLWGDQLNTNMDTIDERLVPTGTINFYAGTTAPNSDWLLCDGAAVSRSTYATLFALVSTSFGVGNGSTTFNVPDLRGRVGVGLDNLGSSSANRITDANADSLNNTGGGSETPTGSLSGTTDAHTLSTAEIPAHTHTIPLTSSTGGAADACRNGDNIQSTGTIASGSTGGGGSHTHNLTAATVTGDAGDNLQPWLALGAIIKT